MDKYDKYSIDRPRRGASNESSLGELIDKFMKAYRLDGKMKELDVINSWSELMGVAVANRTRNIQIKHKTMYLHMDSSVMRQELSAHKTIIIDRVNDKAGFEMITDIYFG
jgi:hypothetical protein